MIETQEEALAEARRALRRIRAMDLKRNEDGTTDFYSGVGCFVRAWLIAEKALRRIGVRP